MDNSNKDIRTYNSKMVGSEVRVIKNGGWKCKVEKVLDDEYFEISKLENPLETEVVSMYDIRSVS